MTVCPRPGFAVLELEFDESALDPDRHSVRPVIGSQLRQDVRDVVFDGFLRDRKLSGDLSIAIAGRDQT